MIMKKTTVKKPQCSIRFSINVFYDIEMGTLLALLRQFKALDKKISKKELIEEIRLNLWNGGVNSFNYLSDDPYTGRSFDGEKELLQKYCKMFNIIFDEEQYMELQGETEE